MGRPYIYLRGHLDRGAAGVLVNPDGSGFEIGPGYAVSLDCKGQYKRPIER